MVIIVDLNIFEFWAENHRLPLKLIMVWHVVLAFLSYTLNHLLKHILLNSTHHRKMLRFSPPRQTQPWAGVFKLSVLEIVFFNLYIIILKFLLIDSIFIYLFCFFNFLPLSCADQKFQIRNRWFETLGDRLNRSNVFKAELFLCDCRYPFLLEWRLLVVAKRPIDDDFR